MCLHDLFIFTYHLLSVALVRIVYNMSVSYIQYYAESEWRIPPNQHSYILKNKSVTSATLTYVTSRHFFMISGQSGETLGVSLQTDSGPAPKLPPIRVHEKADIFQFLSTVPGRFFPKYQKQ